jgi:PAS domain-containing protein
MKSEIDTAQSTQRQHWQNPRIHLLDDMWLLTIVAIVVAIGVPWLFSGFAVQAGAASWGLLGLGGVHIGFTFLGSSTRTGGRSREYALTLLDVVGVMLIGFIWAHVGALQNPLFLMVFVLPVTGSIFLSRWHPFLIALLSILVVSVVALSQAPELRSYASALFGTGAWITDWFGGQGSQAQASFAGFYAPTGYLVAVLEVFSVALFACAVAAEYVGTIFERLLASSNLARSDSEKAQELWATLIERLPIPGLLIDPTSLRIVACSDSARAFLHLGEASPEGLNLFEVARFSFVDLVQEMIGGAVGTATLTALHVVDEVRLAQVRVLQVVHKKRRLTLLTLEDVTEMFCLKAAWDTSEAAALVVDALGRIRAFNKPSAALFGGVKIGANAEQLLSQSVAGLPWWESGLTRRRKMHIEIDSRVYEVTSSEIALPGEAQHLYSVSLLPVARADSADRAGSSAQLVKHPAGSNSETIDKRRERQ